MKGSLKYIIFVALVFSMVLTACQPTATATPVNVTEAQPAATQSVENQSSTTATSDQPVSLVIWEQSADWRIAALKATINAFETLHPNVTIKVESFPYVEYQTKINSAIKAGTAPDMIVDIGQWAVPIINAGLLAEIPSDVLSADTLKSDFYAGPANEAIVNGKVYMVPSTTTMGSGGLIYNEDLLKEAGVSVPPKFSTWEEFMQAAQKCTKYDSDGKMTQAGFSAHGVLESFHLMAYVLQEGDQIISDGKIAFDDANGLAAIQTYQDIFLKYKVDSPDFVGGLDGFPQGRVCMMDIGAWAGAAAKTQNSKLNIGYADPLPSVNPANPTYSQMDTAWQIIVPKASKNQDAVWEFLKFYSSQSQYIARVAFDGELPPLKAAAETFKDDPVMHAYVASADYSVYSGYKVDRDKFNNTVMSYEEKLARGQITPEEALKEMTTDLNAILAGQ